RATGSRMLFDGYHVLYHEAHEPEEGKTLEDLPAIPPLAQGDAVTVKQITPSQHFTEPPPRYSEASLVKELERLGIGRPSTYATIISTLKARWYATAKDRRFAPTPLGDAVWRVMKRSFPAVFEVGFTAQMEDELDKVEDGDLGWQQVLGDFWGPFSKALDAVDVQQIIHDVHDLSELHKEKCPTCGSGLVVKSGRFGPFIACARYPECRFTRPLRRDKVPDKPTDEVWLRGHGGAAVEDRGGDAQVPEVRTRSPGRGGDAGGVGRELRATVVGGGLAGSEAAWALGERGVAVTLHEMRPVRPTPAHQTD